MPGRLIAGVAAVAVLLAAAYGVLFVFLVAAITLDPFQPAGDPCCPYPQSWGEVREGVAWTLGYAAVDAIVLTAAAALVHYAVTGRSGRLRRLALGPGAALVALAVFMVARLWGTPTI